MCVHMYVHLVAKKYVNLYIYIYVSCRHIHIYVYPYMFVDCLYFFLHQHFPLIFILYPYFLSSCAYLYTYIYIYTYMYVCSYVFVYLLILFIGFFVYLLASEDIQRRRTRVPRFPLHSSPGLPGKISKRPSRL